MIKNKKNLLLALALATALGACTDTQDPAAGTANPDGLDPNTPVTLTLTGITPSPAATRATDAATIAAIPAQGEITTATPVGRLSIALPAANEPYGHIKSSSDSDESTAPKWSYFHPEKKTYVPLPQLYLKDFTLSKTKTAAAVGTNRDGNGTVTDLIWSTTLRTDATTAGQASTYAFTGPDHALRHATAKVSLLLVDKDGNDIDPAIVTDVTLTATTGTYGWYAPADGSDGTPGTFIVDISTSISMEDISTLNAWMNQPTSKNLQPEVRFAPDPDGNTTDYALAHPATTTGDANTTAPANLWNALISPIPTVEKDYKITLTLAGGSGTYSIPLSSIQLTGADGTTPQPLECLDANRHLFLTLTLDRLQGLSATAQIGSWDLKNLADVTVGDDDTSEAKLPIEYTPGNDSEKAKLTVRNTEGMMLLRRIVNTKQGADGDKLTDLDLQMLGIDKADDIDIRHTDITLTGNIDLPTVNTDQSNWTPITEYTATFDGGGHTISGIIINGNTAEYQGLFGYFRSGAKVQNLTVTNGTVKGGKYVGAIAGAASGVEITNCHNCGVTVIGSGENVGGIVGSISYNTTITACTNTETVSGSGENLGGITGKSSNSSLITACTNMGTVNGTGNKVGGIAGYNESPITACTNTGTVSGTNNVGGIVGRNYEPITACISTGTVSGTGSNIGGIAGYNNSGIVANYWMSGDGTTDFGIGSMGNNTNATPIPANSDITKWNTTALPTLNTAITKWNTDNSANTNKQCPYHYQPGPLTGTVDFGTQPLVLAAGAPQP